jgi:hypothetical protein
MNILSSIHSAKTFAPAIVLPVVSGSWSSPVSSGLNSNAQLFAIEADSSNNVYVTAASGTNKVVKIPNGSTVASEYVALNGAGYSLKIQGGTRLHIGGTFTQASGVATSNYANINLSTSTVTGVPNLTNGVVYVLEPIGTDDLYIGGNFSTVSGTSTNFGGIFRYNVSTKAISAMGSGLASATIPNCRCSITKDSSNVYFGGVFTGAGGVANTANIASWNGTTWSSLGTGGANGGVYRMALNVAKTILYIAGDFTTVGGVSANRIAQYTIATNTWAAVGNTTNITSQSLSIGVAASGNIYLGTNSPWTTAEGQLCNRIAKYDLATGYWIPLKTGINSLSFGSIITNSTTLYVVGFLTNADGVVVPGIAKWVADPEL